MRHLDPHLSGDEDADFPPAIMARHKREKLLTHVATQVLLRVKWTMLAKIFAFFNVLLFAVFVIVYSCLIVEARDKSKLLSGTKGEELNLLSPLSKLRSGMILIFVIFQFIKEMIQLTWMRLAYFLDLSNFLELVMYAMVWIFVFPFAFDEKDFYSARFQWNAGIVGLLLCYVNLTLCFRRFGGLALYVTMYIEVLWTFVKVISTFLVALVGFSLVFYVILPGQVRICTGMTENYINAAKIFWICKKVPPRFYSNSLI